MTLALPAIRGFNAPMRVLFGWERGGGHGHLVPHIPLLRHLTSEGASLAVVARDVTRAAHWLGDFSDPIVAAPCGPERHDRSHSKTTSLAHVLREGGWSTPAAITALVRAQRTIVKWWNPDLVIVDYAPSLLLALRGMGILTLNLSNGFLNPPPGPLRPYFCFPQDEETGESELLAAIAESGRRGGPDPEVGLDCVADVFHQEVTSWATTLPELDPFSGRGSGCVGVALSAPLARAHVEPFPPGCVAGYLKPFPGLELTLAALARCGRPVILSSDGIPAALRARFASPSLRFSDELLDLAALAPHVALFINNGNHTSTAEALLQGVPVLSIPLVIEQELTARRVEGLGAGRWYPPGRRADAAGILRALLVDPRHGEAARRFAERNRAWRERTMTERVMDRLESWPGYARITSRHSGR